MPKPRWLIKPPPPSSILARFPEIHPLVIQVLYNRGLVTREQVSLYFGEGELADPMQMRGMAEAVARLQRAIRDGELIAVYGDFDVDGVCATALLTETLKSLGARAIPYIPHRINEGYGLNKEALRELSQRGTRVVVTVDCGIRSLPEVHEGVQLGLDMIVTDHHSVGVELPKAQAVINPKQLGDPYPFKEFAGVGIAFKLAEALLAELVSLKAGQTRPVSPEQLLDLVAVGTVADLVPLIGENRTLVRRGIERLNATERPGLQAMIQLLGNRNRRIDAGAIGYGLGPRLNAAGRIEHARTAYAVLVTKYPGEAQELASKLEATNRERQRVTDEMVNKARQMIGADQADEYVVITGSPDFPEGIIGLIASKLQEEAYRPAVVLSHRDGVMRGSARSIPEFNIVAALDECADLLVRHGGHAAAAGFTVENDKFDELCHRLRQIAARELGAVELVPTLNIDAEAPLPEMNWALHSELERLAPFGYGNREPVFLSRNVTVRSARIVGSDHLSMLVTDGVVVWDAIAFRQKDLFSLLNPLPAQVDLVYSLTSKMWQGESRLQLEVKDLRLAGR